MGKQSPSPVGRALIHAPFWLIAAAVAVSILGSIVVDLHGSPPEGEHSESRWCHRSLVALRDALDAQLGVAWQLRRKHGAKNPWVAFDERFAPQLDRAQSRCEGLEDRFSRAFAELTQMHSAYRTIVASMDDSHEARRALNQTLEQIEAPEATAAP